MRRTHVLMALVVVAVSAAFAFYPALAQSQTSGTESQVDNRAGWYCPYCGSYMGPGYGGYGMGPGMMGPGYGRGYGMMGPGYGGYGMGPGMMGGYGRGYGMGPGVMGPGYGRGYGMMGPGMMGPGYGYEPPEYRQPPKPLDEKDAKTQVEDYLKMGSVKDKGNAFEVEIRTKNNSLVDKILVDKNTGWMRSKY